jgi:LAO/AO transport system kinase
MTVAYVPSCDLVRRAVLGEVPAIARLISRAEVNALEAREPLTQIYWRTGRAHIIGITGVPGSGKSTLVAALTARLRVAGSKVAIVAVDPSSPHSGGAILGDRIRMSDLANDPGVYIRSMATHGAVGGIARATLDAVDILDAGGFDKIIIETVGVGQDEVEIAKASDTTIVVSAPGLGDEIQALKAGMLEIADIHVVSKSDRSDAKRTLIDIRQMLTMDVAVLPPSEWRTKAVGVSSFTGEGLDELLAALDQHHALILDSEIGRRRRLSVGGFRIQKTAENMLLDRFNQLAVSALPALASRLQRREADPYSLAAELVGAALTHILSQQSPSASPA